MKTELNGKDSLKIALVGLGFPFRGGIAHFTTRLCKELREKHQVFFFSFSRQYPEFLFPGKSQFDESKTYCVEENFRTIDSLNPFSWVRTGKKISQYKPHLCVISWWHPFFAFAFSTIARVAKVPTCYLCHNILPHESSFLDRLLIRFGMAPCNLFITMSQSNLEILQALRPDAKIIASIHPIYGQEIPHCHGNTDDIKNHLGLDSNKKILLFFGFVRKYKGLSVLLDSMMELESEYHLMIVGEFYHARENYEPKIKNLVESGKVSVVDRYISNEEMASYFQAADVVITPYTEATQSGVIQTAYGFEKPVIATTAGGLGEYVINGKTGYLVSPNNSRELTQKIRGFFGQRDTIDFTSNIKQFCQLHSWSTLAESVEQAAHMSADDA